MRPQNWTENAEAKERPGPWAFQMALCLLGPLFFLSYLLSLLSPLPLLYLIAGNPEPKKARAWGLLAVVVGVLLLGAIKGWVGAFGFFALAAVPAWVMGEALLRKQGPERAVAAAIAAVFALLLLGAGAIQASGRDSLATTRNWFDQSARSLAENTLSRYSDSLQEADREELRKVAANPSELYKELPGILASALLLLCLLPTLALIRWNPKGFLRRTGISRDYLRKWQTPDWLIWVTLFCGTFQVFSVDYLSTITRNALTPLLLIYFFQGMSIVAYFLDSLRLRGPIRILLYGIGTLFLNPMVVSFGFFDFWFNFRSRQRPTTVVKEDKADKEGKEP